MRRVRGPYPSGPIKAAEPIDVKPFALQYLESGDIHQQHQSPLFRSIPKEIRDLIFEFALVAYPDPDRPYSNKEPYARPGVSGHPRVAIELLLTCKAVYVETYQLPITLNPVIIYHDSSGHVPPHARRGARNLTRLTSTVWQRAALHMVDISLQQFHLERHVISQTANQVQAGTRFDQAQAAKAPRDDIVVSEGDQAQPESDLSTAVASAWPLMESAHPQPQRLSGLEMPSADYNIPRPISKLTLRLGRTEWWTWEDWPDSNSQLGIDPAHGDGSVNRRCSTETMILEAERRRNGDWSGWTDPGCWGAQVAEFKGLKELECVFETFKLKEKQLETVIACAKTWVFPMGDGYELRWDGKIGVDEWLGVENYGYEKRNAWLRVHYETILPLGEMTEEEFIAENEARRKFVEENPRPDHRLFVVRTIRFTRRKCGSQL